MLRKMIKDKLRESELLRVDFDRLSKMAAEAGRLLATDSDINASKGQQLVSDMLKEVNYNMAPFTPFFYPDYLRGDNNMPAPLSFITRPYAWEVFAWNIHGINVLRGARQINKSTMLCCRADMLAHIIPGYTTLFVTPMAKQIQTVAYKYKEMADANILFRNAPVVRGGVKKKTGQLYYREYDKGGKTKLVFAMTSAHATRGFTSDALDYDECLAGSTEITTSSGEGIRVTALLPGTDILCFDASGNTRHDRVKSVVSKGIRATWRVTLVEGSFLECTANERFWSDVGWVYLGQLLSAAETPRCGKIAAINEAFGKLSPEDTRLYAEVDGGVFPETIKSIEFVGEQEVWDVETECYHTLFANGFAVHNCQNFDGSLETDIDPVLTTSKIPTRSYSGTSLGTESFLESKYEDTSKGTWHILCRHCGHWSDTGNEEQCHRMIAAEGLVCAQKDCGKILDISQGEYVHENWERYDDGFIGVHIPQIIVPDLVYDKAKWNKIYELFISGDRVKFNQEVLGLAQADGAREISQQDLIDICVLNWGDVQVRAGGNRYQLVVSGCDWGGSDYNPANKTKKSYTQHSMIGLNIDGSWDIIHMKKYAGQDYETIADDILTNHLAKGGKAVASDYGGGQLYNNLFRKSGRIHPNSHIVFDYTSPEAAFLARPKESVYPGMMMLNRSESITAMFNLIKSPARRLRCYEWAKAKECLLDITSILRAPQDRMNGRSRMLYIRHGSKPDDTLHSLNFAYHLGRILAGMPVNAEGAVISHIRNTVTGSFSGNFGGAPLVTGMR